MTVPPMRSEARAIVTMPVPRLMSTAFWDCAIRQPERPVRAFAAQRPTVVVNAGFTDEERTMSGLLPVARIARPRRVRRKSVMNTSARSTAAPETMSL